MLKLDEPADQVLNSARLPGSFVRETTTTTTTTV